MNTVKRPLYFSRALFLAYAFVLLGYMMLGKGFAYIGIGQFRVGEVLLCFGLVYLVFSPFKRSTFQNPFWFPFFIWVIWSCMVTLPYVPTYGLYSFRDGVVWGYALFALISAKLLINKDYLLEELFEKYAKIAPFVLFFAPMIFLSTSFFKSQLAVIFGGAAQFMKAGDIMVHLAGITVLIAFGLVPARLINLLLLSATVFIAAAKSRSGFLTYFMSITLAGFIFPKLFVRSMKILGLLFSVGGLVAIFVFASGIKFELQGRREVSPVQIIENIVSIFTEDKSNSSLDGSRTWRLRFWSDIVDYTIFGDYLWAGRGYGINLADASGFQVVSKASGAELLRSPHNIHITILARSGVVGLFFWIVLNLTWVFQMFKSYQYARYLGDNKATGHSAFLLTVWLAMQINASFDVYLEGPMGGIWFWTIIGIGVAHTQNIQMRAQRKKTGIQPSHI